MTIVGQQFVAVGGENQSIQSIVGDGFADGGMDMLQVWNGSSYDDYYYYTASDDINGDGTAAWGNLDWESSDAAFAPGTGMWLTTQNASTIVFVGEVGTTNKVAVHPGLNLITQTAPMDVDIQDITGEGLADGGMDMLQVWNGSSYDDYYYYTASDDINGDGTAAWGNLDWEPVSATLYAGHGFWFSSQNEGVLSFPEVNVQ